MTRSVPCSAFVAPGVAASAEMVRAILGPLDDDVVAAVLALGVDEQALLEARMRLDADATALPEARRAASAEMVWLMDLLDPPEQSPER